MSKEQGQPTDPLEEKYNKDISRRILLVWGSAALSVAGVATTIGAFIDMSSEAEKLKNASNIKERDTALDHMQTDGYIGIGGAVTTVASQIGGRLALRSWRRTDENLASDKV